jgi:hypothetical protein
VECYVYEAQTDPPAKDQAVTLLLGWLDPATLKAGVRPLG